MIAIFDVQTEVTYCKNIAKFGDNWSIFMWFTAHTNIQTVRKTLNRTIFEKIASRSFQNSSLVPQYQFSKL